MERAKLGIEDALKRVFLLQLSAMLLVWFFFEFEFTKPVDVGSADIPWFAPQGILFTIHIPVILLLFLAVTFAPIIEVFSFRGPLWWIARNKSLSESLIKSPLHFWLLIVAGGFAFGLLHINYMLEWRLATAFFGATLAWLVLAYKKLWPAILLHYLWNIMLASFEFLFSPHVRKELEQLVTFLN